MTENTIPSRTIARINIPGMNTLRFFLAVWVMIVHYPVFPQVLNVGFEYATLPNFNWLGWFYTHMVDPVPVFWALAGAVFAGAYPVGQNFSISKFWIARVARLYPLHILCLILTVIAHRVLPKVTTVTFSNENILSFIPHLLLISNWFVNIEGPFNGVTWSISVELIAYVVYSVLRLVKVQISTILVLVISGLCHIVTPSGAKLSPFICIWLFMLTNCLVHHFYVLNRNKYYTALVPIIFLCVCISVITPNYAIMVRPVGIVLVVIAIFSLLPERCDVKSLGDITYGLYLCHFLILEFMIIGIRLLKLAGSIVLSPYFQLVYFSLVLGISFLLFKVLEEPARKQSIRILSNIWAK